MRKSGEVTEDCREDGVAMVEREGSPRSPGADQKHRKLSPNRAKWSRRGAGRDEARHRARMLA